MTGDEVVSDISAKCREIMDKHRDKGLSEKVALDLMQLSAIHGFGLGSRTALAMVQGALATQQIMGMK